MANLIYEIERKSNIQIDSCYVTFDIFKIIFYVINSIAASCNLIVLERQ